LLVKRKVIETMKWPYVQGIQSGDSAFSDNGVCGEDYYFCLKAKELGFKVWLDPRVNMVHWGGAPYGVWDCRK
jgi:hypothetical protein